MKKKDYLKLLLGCYVKSAVNVEKNMATGAIVPSDYTIVCMEELVAVFIKDIYDVRIEEELDFIIDNFWCELDITVPVEGIMEDLEKIVEEARKSYR